jgi:hypothetical protein
MNRRSSGRAVLLGLVCITILLITVVHRVGIALTIVGLSVAIGVFSPPWSERLIAYWWQFFTPHLLRSGLYHAGIQNRDGRQPLIVGVTREPWGERVRLRCPVGTSAEDIHAARPLLRAACRAADVRVSRDEQRAHIVTVDVIRRPNDFDPNDSWPGGLGIKR